MPTLALFATWRRGGPALQSLLRIVAAFMFLQAGTMKLFAWSMGMPPDGSTAKLLTQIGIGGLLEVVGGLLLPIGLWTRPVAFLLAGEMAVAYFQFHQPGGSGRCRTTAWRPRSTTSSGSTSRRPARDPGASTRGGAEPARDGRRCRAVSASGAGRLAQRPWPWRWPLQACPGSISPRVPAFRAASVASTVACSAR